MSELPNLLRYRDRPLTEIEISVLDDIRFNDLIEWYNKTGPGEQIIDDILERNEMLIYRGQLEEYMRNRTTQRMTFIQGIMGNISIKTLKNFKNFIRNDETIKIIQKMRANQLTRREMHMYIDYRLNQEKTRKHYWPIIQCHPQ